MAVNVDASKTGIAGGGGSTTDGALETTQKREHIKLQNLVGQSADGAWPIHIGSYTIGDKYRVNVASAGLAVGDVILRKSVYVTYVPDPAYPDDLWTAPGLVSWYKVYDATSSSVSYVTVPAINTSLADLIEPGITLKQAATRTIQRQVVAASLDVTINTVTETRVIQASHIYPYTSISDSGWV